MRGQAFEIAEGCMVERANSLFFAPWHSQMSGHASMFSPLPSPPSPVLSNVWPPNHVLPSPPQQKSHTSGTHETAVIRT